MAQRVRKAVLPVAGLGTRFLPATKAMPKEMLTVVDRPLIQYAIEECLGAGIEEFVFVTGRNKGSLEDHFDSAYELEDTLVRRKKTAELKQTEEATIKAGNAIFTLLGFMGLYTILAMLGLLLVYREIDAGPAHAAAHSAAH